MKQFKASKIVSILCSVIGLILSLKILNVGVKSIGAPGLGSMGEIFIIPSVIFLLAIIFDLLITLDFIKKGLIYSCINSTIKIVIVVCLVPTTIDNYIEELKYGVSNFDFCIKLIVVLITIAIPSILNIIKLVKSKIN